jgi:ribosomal protein S18 acetylase RimI-like enzyme
LIREAEIYAREIGTQAILFHVEKSNTAAFRLYERLGYKIFRDDGNRYMMIKNDGIQIREEHISAKEYIDFLKRTDLGSQYPKERFEERIKKLVENVSISLIARNEAGTVVGVLFGLTDFCYWLYVTDLGVDRDYERQGIATRLMKTAHEIAGGEKDIAVYLIANEDAVPFYEKIGMKKADEVMKYNHIEWTEWTV